jgi:hypothetical protein
MSEEGIKGELEAAKRLIVSAAIASCNCNTKSPEPVHHEPTCRYWKLMCALERVEGAEEDGAAVEAKLAAIIDNINRYGLTQVPAAEKRPELEELRRLIGPYAPMVEAWNRRADPAPQPATSTVEVERLEQTPALPQRQAAEAVLRPFLTSTAIFGITPEHSWVAGGAEPYHVADAIAQMIADRDAQAQERIAEAQHEAAIAIGAALEDKKRAVEEVERLTNFGAPDVGVMCDAAEKAGLPGVSRMLRALLGKWRRAESAANVAEARAEKAEAALRAIITCTHRPNPTDSSRIDVAPGKHRAFQEAVERGAALTKERSE